MDFIWWLIALVLMAVGLIGTVLPAVPGAIIILAAAVIHQMMLGSEKSLGWWNVAALALLTLLSYALEFAAGYFGAKRFGATKWGAFGAMVGAIVGLFFSLPGLIIGPIVGAIAGEFMAGKHLVSAGRAGWGTLLGNLAGMVGKLTIGLVMVSWFLVTAPAPFERPGFPIRRAFHHRHCAGAATFSCRFRTGPGLKQCWLYTNGCAILGGEDL